MSFANEQIVRRRFDQRKRTRQYDNEQRRMQKAPRQRLDFSSGPGRGMKRGRSRDGGARRDVLRGDQ